MCPATRLVIFSQNTRLVILFYRPLITSLSPVTCQLSLVTCHREMLDNYHLLPVLFDFLSLYPFTPHTAYLWTFLSLFDCNCSIWISSNVTYNYLYICICICIMYRKSHFLLYLTPLKKSLSSKLLKRRIKKVFLPSGAIKDV